MAFSLTVWDGAGCIGGNKILLEEGGDGILLDFGKNFSKYATFYEEYLKSRTTRGIHDLLYLGMIPPLKLYRRDLIPADLAGFPLREANVSALLISHAHLDHCGNAGLLRCSIPFVSTQMTFAILKAYQDTGKSTMEADLVYTSSRTPLEGEPLYLATRRSEEYRGRDLCCTSPPTQEFREFLYSRPGEGEKGRGGRMKGVMPGRCGCLEELPLHFGIMAIEVDHSIPGACGYVIEGDGTIAYTGDLRLHGSERERTLRFAEAARGAEVLIVEGTRIGEPDAASTTEAEVMENCLREARAAKGLIIADFSSRNFERLEVFREVARRSGRELVVTAKDAYQLMAMQRVDGADRIRGLRIYDAIADHGKYKWDSEVVRRRALEQHLDPADIREDPGRYILAFSYYDMNHLLDIKPEGGLYIYSSCEPFSEEMEIDLRRLSEWLDFFGIERCGFHMERSADGGAIPCVERGYHASGHASGEDLHRLIERIDPDLIVPVHTEHPMWFRERFECVIVPERGKRYEF